MNLQEAYDLKMLMKDNPDLFAVNNLRDFSSGEIGNRGWRVDAHIKETGQVVRFKSLEEYQDWIVDLSLAGAK